jgi:hypothetical protein
MNVRLHIERVVVDAAIVGPMPPERLESAIGRALRQLLSTGRLAPEMASGGNVRVLRQAADLPPSSAGPAAMGAAIAGAVYRSVGVPPATRRR